MKKILAILLAMLMVTALTVAMASGDTGVSGGTTTVDIAASQNLKGADASVPHTFTITKNYTVTYENAPTPGDTLKFTVSDGDFSNDGAVEPDEVPAVVIKEVTVKQGDTSADIVVSLPAYSVPGVYTYTFTEVDTNIAGITYTRNEYTLVVTVENEVDADGTIVTGSFVISGIAVHVSEEGTDTKVKEFENKYDAGKLTVTKKVTGSMGDTQKDWNFTVVFTAPEGDTVNAPITYTLPGETTAFSIAAGWTKPQPVTFTLKHDQSVTFENLPKGVTYTVLEAEAGMDGYTTTVEATDTVETETTQDATTEATEAQVSGGITKGAEEDTATFTNNKTTEIDTGINMTTLPYVLIAALAIAGAAIMMIRRRRAIED